MGKLLTLATHCINDKKFYGSRTKTRIEKDIRHSNNEKFSIFVNVDSITPKVVDTYGFKNKVFDIYRNQLGSLGYNYSKALKISFEDEPPIWVLRVHVTESEKEVIEILDWAEKKWKLKFLNKTMIHSVKCVLTTYKFEYRITCGSIDEVITEEQFNNLIETYENNKIKQQQEADEAKINLRLKDYQ